MARDLQILLVLAGVLAATISCGHSGNAASAQPGSGSGGQGMMGAGMMQGSMARHRQAMMTGLPAAYASLTNPLPENAATLARGATLFRQNCVACHGQRGFGDGPAASQLNPKPANLTWSARMPMTRSEAYLYWTISEGGQQFGTAMPAFKQTLPSKDIWAVAAYVRAGLPEQQ